MAPYFAGSNCNELMNLSNGRSAGNEEDDDDRWLQ